MQDVSLLKFTFAFPYYIKKANVVAYLKYQLEQIWKLEANQETWKELASFQFNLILSLSMTSSLAFAADLGLQF